MAFKALPEGRRGLGKSPTNTLMVGSFKNTGNTFHTSFSIPRALLREAGLPDYPGAKFDILIGEGADRGSVAIIAGPRFSATKVGTGVNINRVAVGSSLLSGAVMKSTPAEYEVGDKQLIIHMPPGFVWRTLETPVVQLGAAA